MSFIAPSKPDAINFVWFGPPKINDGGMDVRAPITIWKNFQIYTAHATQNPMHFWCQGKYLDIYIQYFAKNKITIEIHSVEEHLSELAFEDEMADPYTTKTAKIVLALIQDFVSEGRNRIDERVNAKDLFFYFLMATIGGYAMDTTFTASAKNPVRLHHYRDHKFMWERKRDIPEISIQFSPSEKLDRARKVLSMYIKKMVALEEEYLKDQNVEMYYLYSRYISVEAIALDASMMKRNIDNPELFFSDTEGAKRRARFKDFALLFFNDEFSSFRVKIPELQLIKEFNNSHRLYRDKRLPMPFFHALYGQLEDIKFDIEHGIKPTSRLTMEFSSKENNEFDAQRIEDVTLLHAVAWFSGQEAEVSDSDFEPDFLASARFLLLQGADPELPCTIYPTESKDDARQVETPISIAITQKNPAMLKLFLQYARTKVSQMMVNDKPILWSAIINEFDVGVEILLQYGANPNVILNEIDEDPYLETSENPFHYAIRIQNANLLRNLFRSGIKPEAISSIYTDGHGRVTELTYDQLLLASSDACKHIFNRYMRRSAASVAAQTIFISPPEPNQRSQRLSGDSGDSWHLDMINNP